MHKLQQNFVALASQQYKKPAVLSTITVHELWHISLQAVSYCHNWYWSKGDDTLRLRRQPYVRR